jgi:hypothetical protein
VTSLQDVLLTGERLHREFTQSTEDQESILDEKIVGGQVLLGV